MDKGFVDTEEDFVILPVLDMEGATGLEPAIRTCKNLALSSLATPPSVSEGASKVGGEASLSTFFGPISVTDEVGPSLVPVANAIRNG